MPTEISALFQCRHHRFHRLFPKKGTVKSKQSDLQSQVKACAVIKKIIADLANFYYFNYGYDKKSETKVKLQLVPVNRVRRRLGLIYGGIGTLLFLLARAEIAFTLPLPPCPFYTVTGLPCPVCGATRAGVDLANLQIGSAFFTNPLFTLFYLSLAAWAFYSIAGLFYKQLYVMQIKRIKPASKLLIFLFLLNWAYLIVHTLWQEH